MIHLFQQAGIEESEAIKASKLIESHDKKIFAFSGKIASGKDTIGIALSKLLAPQSAYAHVSFASALKAEVDTVIKGILNGTEVEELSSQLSVSPEVFAPIIEWVKEDMKLYNEVDVYKKTPGARKIVQYWGTDVRRKQNPHYWIHKTLQEIVSLLLKEDVKTILLTDTRFPNELEAMNSIGACSVRLEVDPSIQRQRLLMRDGHDVIPEHSSETALDDHLEDFHIVLHNNEETITPVLEKLIPKVRGFYG